MLLMSDIVFARHCLKLWFCPSGFERQQLVVLSEGCLWIGRRGFTDECGEGKLGSKDRERREMAPERKTRAMGSRSG